MILFGGWANRWFGDICVCKVRLTLITVCTHFTFISFPFRAELAPGLKKASKVYTLITNF